VAALTAANDLNAATRPLWPTQVDEAGQVSLADALAMGTCARNLVLVGDPQQLDQVIQGTHSGGTDDSVLNHLIGDAETIPPDRGLFLEQTFRLHPDVCAYISDEFYEGRLRSDPVTATRTTPLGTGLRWLARLVVLGIGEQPRGPAEQLALAAVDVREHILDPPASAPQRRRTRPVRQGQKGSHRSAR